MFSFIRQNFWQLFLTTGLGLLAILSSSLVGYFVIAHQTDIQAFGWQQWTLVFLVACFTMAIALTHASLVALVSGYFLGVKAVIPVVVSYWFASLLGFALGRLFDKGKLLDYFLQNPKVKDIFDKLSQEQFKIILLARLSPVLPFALMNLLFSFAGVRLRNFLTAGLVGMLPRTMLLLWVGSQAQYLQKAIQESPTGWVQASVVGLIVLSIWGLVRVFQKALH
jgi:uncharacterized membrane protein YdjX (TVP38/TMEM64 family)